MPAFTIKSNFNGDVRRSTADSVLSLAELAALENNLYRFSKPVTLKYLDDEQDAITIASDADVSAAFAAAASDGSFVVRVNAVENVTSTVVSNINSPITTVADNPVTAVPINANVATNAPTTAVPVVGNAVTTVPIADCNSNVSPITNSPVIVTNFDGSSINNTVVTISDVNVTNASVAPKTAAVARPAAPAPASASAAPAMKAPFVQKHNAAVWMPMIAQLANIGYADTQRNIDLLNHFGGNFLCALAQLVQDHAQARV